MKKASPSKNKKTTEKQWEDIAFTPIYRLDYHFNRWLIPFLMIFIIAVGALEGKDRLILFGIGFYIVFIFIESLRYPIKFNFTTSKLIVKRRFFKDLELEYKNLKRFIWSIYDGWKIVFFLFDMKNCKDFLQIMNQLYDKKKIKFNYFKELEYL